MFDQSLQETDVLIVGCEPFRAVPAGMLGRRNMQTLVVDEVSDIFAHRGDRL